MAEIIPAILTNHFEELQQQVRAAERFASFLHIDITDGVFVESRSIGAAEIRTIAPSIPFEIHCMVKRPEDIIDDCIATGAQRIIVHRHATEEELTALLQRIQRQHCEACIAVSASSLSDDLAPYLSLASQVTYLTVTPGYQGSAMIPGVLVKAKSFHESHPEFPLEIDGGIKETNIAQTIQTGANRYVVGSGIWATENPAAAYARLSKMVQ